MVYFVQYSVYTPKYIVHVGCVLHIRTLVWSGGVVLVSNICSVHRVLKTACAVILAFIRRESI